MFFKDIVMILTESVWGADSVKIISWQTYTLPPLANAIYTHPFSTAFRLITKYIIKVDYMKTFV